MNDNDLRFNEDHEKLLNTEETDDQFNEIVSESFDREFEDPSFSITGTLYLMRKVG